MIHGRVFVTREIHEDALELLRKEFSEVEVWESHDPPTKDDLKEKASHSMALITMLTDQVDGELFDSAPLLKVVANVAVGYDNFDVGEATRRRIMLTNTPDVLTEATADLTFGLLLSTARRINEAANAAADGRWGPWHPKAWLGYDVHGSQIGIIGLGRIGQAIARRAHGFGMKILYHSRNRRKDLESSLGLIYVLELKHLLNAADFVTLHLPLTVETRHFIGKPELEEMKSSGILINSSRGDIVDQDALTEAIRNGVIAGVGLDVTSPEPLLPTNPLFGFDNVVVTPHIGSASHGSRRDMAIAAAQNVIASCLGQTVPSPIHSAT